MSDMKARLKEDRAMRDAAKALVTSDVQHLRGDVAEQGIGKRAAIRMREGAEGLVDDTSQFAREHPERLASALGLGISLLLGWLFRDQISEWAEENWHHLEEFAEQIVGDDD